MNKIEKITESRFNSVFNSANNEPEARPKPELLPEESLREEMTFLQGFQGKTKNLAKIFVLITALVASAEFARPVTAFAQERQKIEKREKTSDRIKKEQAKKIAERLKDQYLRSDLLPENYQNLIKKYRSVEVASFWFARIKASEILNRVQEEQGIDRVYRKDGINGEIFIGHTDHLQEIAIDLESWSVSKLAGRIARQFSDKFTPATMPRDEIKEDVIKAMRQKGIYFAETHKFASGSQLRDILEIIEKIEKQDYSLMKLKFFTLEYGSGGWGSQNAVHIRSDIFNPDKILRRFQNYPGTQIKWVFAHEMGHLSFDDLSKQEQEQWRELQVKKDFKSMIENSYNGDHRYPEMFSYYFIDRDDMISKIDSEQDGGLKEKLIRQFDFIADKCKGKSFNASLRELNLKNGYAN